MPEILSLEKIRANREQKVGTQNGVQKSPTTEDKKTPKKKAGLKKSVSFENCVKGVGE